MAQLTIRYLTTRPRGSRNGGGMRYFWQPRKVDRAQGWKVVRLPDDETDAMREAQRLNRELDEWRMGTRNEPTSETPGTIDAVIALYLNSDEFAEKKPNTQRTYRQGCKLVSAWAGDQPAACITPKMVQTFYKEMAHKLAVANKTIRTLGVLMAFARRDGIIKENPVLRPRLKTRRTKGRLWSPAAVRHMAATADAMGMPSIGTAILLNEWLGQRKADIIGLKRRQYDCGLITIVQEKTGVEVQLDISIVAELGTRLAKEIGRSQALNPHAEEILLNADGRKWNEYEFTHAVQAVRTEATKTMPEVEGLVFQHLRHTAITRMGEAGLEPQQIAAVSGHSMKQVHTILQVYTVTTRRMAKNAIEKRHAFELSERKKSNVRPQKESNKTLKTAAKNANNHQ